MTTPAWQNGDGLQVRFPNFYRDATNRANRSRDLETENGGIQQIELDIDLTAIPTGTISYSADLNNDGTNDGFSLNDPYLPANASVIRVTLVTVVAATGGTSFVMGTFQLNGTAISANSLVTATEGVIANFATVGFRTYGAGALVSASAGTAGVGTKNSFIGITGTGTFTAGKIRALIEYVVPVVDAVANF